MDDTTQSRISDAATSAATRKRRSSILKSQRPPRTPFCELEFNVCTPTDSAKSRRVSFSRRTGVAEFVTNEATTTWKNFYEEHNKSLESSGNDSEVNHGKQTIAHLGKRIFDQQFEEVEAVDFMGSLNPGLKISTSINNINYQQLEYTDGQLTAPQNNFELSAFTEQQSKLFSEDLNITRAGEVSDRIDVNFSEIQQIGENDDLDEIQKDLQRQSNVICRSPFGRDNLSEYIEVDLNMTNVAMTNDESDMSITDTVHSPKVQDVSKSCSIDKNIRVNEDWVADKENIVVNPYVAPRESLNFVVNEEVLVFDGKKLIIQTQRSKNEEYRQTLLPNPSEQAPQRKTIVLNCNDDLPNFIEEAQASKNSSGLIGVSELKQNIILDMSVPQLKLDETQNKLRTHLYNDDLSDISLTQTVPKSIPKAEKRQTILYENDDGNISITQAVPSKIIDKGKRKTIVYENDSGNISITQAVPENLLLSNENNEKRKTIVFENEACNISMTQSLPANIIPENTAIRNRTIILEDGTTNVSITQLIPKTVKKDSNETRRIVVYEDNTGNISVTHLITSCKNSDRNVALPERRKTIVFESDIADISVTQALPSNIMHQKLNVTSYENDANISMTQAVPTINILLGDKFESNRRRTVLYENDTGNISITQAVPTNQIIQGLPYCQEKNIESSETAATTNKLLHDINKKVSANYTRTIVFESKNADKSTTQAANLDEVLPCLINTQKEILYNKPSEEMTGDKMRSTIFRNELADLSIDQTVPMKQIIETINEQKQKVPNNFEAINAALHKDGSNKKRRTIVFDNDDADISMTEAVPMNQVIDAINRQKQEETDKIEATNTALHKNSSRDKRRTLVFGNDDADISITQAVSMNQVIDTIKEQNQKETDNIKVNNADLHKDRLDIKRRTLLFENDDAEISMTQAVPMNQVIDAINRQKQEETDKIEAINTALHKNSSRDKRRTLVFGNDGADISITQAVSMNQVIDTIKEQNQKETDNIKVNNADLHKDRLDIKRRTLLFENDDAEISMTQAVPMNQVIDAINRQKQEETDKIEAINTALHKNSSRDKRRTLVFGNDDADISITQAVPMNQVIDTIKEQKQKETDYVEATNAALHKEHLSNKRRTLLFENDDADISMTEAVSMNQVIDTINKQKQKESDDIEATNTALHNECSKNKTRALLFDDDAYISMNQVDDTFNKHKQKVTDNIETINGTLIIESSNNKRRTVVFENDDADISMTQAVPINQLIDLLNGQKRNENDNTEATNEVLHEKDSNYRRGTIAYENDDASISLTQAVNLNQVLGQKNKEKQTVIQNKLERAEKTALRLHNNPTGDKSRILVYSDDEDDISMAQTNSANIVLPDGLEKKKTIVMENVESLLENITLFTVKDKVTDIIQENESNLLLSEKEDNDISMSELSDPKSPVKTKITYEQDTDMPITQAMFENCNLKTTENKTRSVVFNETIPINDATIPLKPMAAELLEIQDKTLDKSYKNEITEYDMLVKLTNVVSDVVVYQAMTTNRKQKLEKPNKRDSQEPFVIPDEAKTATPTTIPHEIESCSNSSDEISSEVPVNKQNDEQPDAQSDFNGVDLVVETTRIDSIDMSGIKPKDSILNDLLDMSHSSFEGEVRERIGIAKMSSGHTSLLGEDRAEIKSSNTKYSDDDSQADKSVNNKESNSRDITKARDKSLRIEYTDKEEPVVVKEVQKKQSKLKSVLKRIHSPLRQHSNQSPISTDIGGSESLIMSGRKSSKSFKMANNTNELLEMLSDFTDKQMSRNLDPHLEENEDVKEPVHVKEYLESENKEEATGPDTKRSSFAPKRQSVALSREDLLNNLSMAGAALQKSRFELDESDNIEDVTKETPEYVVSHKKPVRPSAEVVKTLHFEDEYSVSEKSESIQTFESPLKKAFEETSHMKESKLKVIPDFSQIPDGIKELMNDLVKPMADVLPFVTTTLDKGLKENASTCSMQVQANKLPSSQIDLLIEQYSNSESVYDMSKVTSIDTITDAVNRSISRAFQRPVSVTPTPTPAHTHSEKSFDMNVLSEDFNETVDNDVKYSITTPTKFYESNSPGRVLIFDHDNPLNNVFLAPPQVMDVHGYDPIKSDESIAKSEHSNKISTIKPEQPTDSTDSRISDLNQSCTENTDEAIKPRESTDKPHEGTDKALTPHKSTDNAVILHVSTDNAVKLRDSTDKAFIPHKNTDVTPIPHESNDVAPMPNKNTDVIVMSYKSTDAAVLPHESIGKVLISQESTDDSESNTSNSDKPIDQDINEHTRKDTEVNTVIVMKGNKELLESSSSLTLVDDALNRSKMDWNINLPTYEHKEDEADGPPLQIIYKLEEASEDKFDSDLTSYEDKSEKTIKQKKRVYSPKQRRDKQCTLSCLDITPKPVSKIRKRATNSFNYERPTKLTAEQDKSPKTQKSPRKCNAKTPPAIVTVQHLTNVKTQDNSEQKTQDAKKKVQERVNTGTEPRSRTVSRDFSEMISFPSNNNLKDQTMPSYSKLASGMSSSAWLPQTTSSDVGSKLRVTECDSYLDIVSKIYSIPLMGSNDCEWETNTGDTWTFLLLHSWLRLTVHFAHGTRVQADTPVVNISLETLHQARKSPVALLCVQFAAETMRYYASRGCAVAWEVARLVRRLGAAARLAARWARAMHDARARLAYSLAPDGRLALKVANTSLHRVWEVTMKLELVVENEQSMPWPRACAVRVAGALDAAPAPAPAPRALRLLLQHTPRDWGHAPRTLWKIFRYLKQLKVEEEPASPAQP